MSLTEQQLSFKPFTYPWCFQAYQEQQKVHWLPEEVPMADDVKDYNKLTNEEKALLDNILCFFTQADIDVAGSYYDLFIPHFKNTEVRMMLGSFANMEAIHIDAYSTLVETLGMGDKTFSAFMEYKEMKDKHDYLKQFRMDKPWLVAQSLAAISAFGEGLQLFASFAMLMNFQRFNKMKGMGQIVTWSLRDESLHVESMIRLFKVYLKEHENIINPELLEKDIRNICNDVISHEDKFIDLAFMLGGVKGLTSLDMKQYIRYIAGARLNQLGYQHDLPTVNPLDWMNNLLALPEHANFFEVRATEYSKASTTGNWGDVFND
jgi:ribonucleoside-diphosphate reductase beta chain